MSRRWISRTRWRSLISIANDDVGSHFPSAQRSVVDPIFCGFVGRRCSAFIDFKSFCSHIDAANVGRTIPKQFPLLFSSCYFFVWPFFRNWMNLMLSSETLPRRVASVPSCSLSETRSMLLWMGDIRLRDQNSESLLWAKLQYGEKAHICWGEKISLLFLRLSPGATSFTGQWPSMSRYGKSE